MVNILLYKSSRNVLGPRGACSPVGKNISDDNRYEHGAVRSNAEMLIPVSGTEAAKQRSDAGTYTVCGAMLSYGHLLYKLFENADRPPVAKRA